MATETPSETTEEVWRAAGRYEGKPSLLTLTVTKGRHIIPSGRWTLTFTYQYLHERHDTLVTENATLARDTFIEWFKANNMGPRATQGGTNARRPRNLP